MYTQPGWNKKAIMLLLLYGQMGIVAVFTPTKDYFQRRSLKNDNYVYII